MPSIESQVLPADKVISVLGIDTDTLQTYTTRHAKLLSNYASGTADAHGYTATDISLLESIQTWSSEGNSPEKIDTLLMQKLEAMLENVGDDLSDEELEILSVFDETEAELADAAPAAADDDDALFELEDDKSDFMISALTENSNRNREKLDSLNAKVGGQEDIIKALSSELADLKAAKSEPKGLRRLANVSIMLSLITLVLVGLAFFGMLLFVLR